MCELLELFSEDGFFLLKGVALINGLLVLGFGSGRRQRRQREEMSLSAVDRPHDRSSSDVGGLLVVGNLSAN